MQLVVHAEDLVTFQIKETKTPGRGVSKPIILALRKLRQKNQKFGASLDYIAKPFQK